MKRFFLFAKIYLLSTFCINSYKACSQNITIDSAAQATAFHNAVNLYHHSLSPETGLYNGSEYQYNLYYPATFNEGHPFFVSRQFDSGTIVYNDIMYRKVPLLYDVVMDELVNYRSNQYVSYKPEFGLSGQ